MVTLVSNRSRATILALARVCEMESIPLDTEIAPMQSRLSIRTVLAVLVSVAVCKHVDASDPSQAAQTQADKAQVTLPIVIADVKRVFDLHAG
jgi:hypothetical protein